MNAIFRVRGVISLRSAAFSSKDDLNKLFVKFRRIRTSV